MNKKEIVLKGFSEALVRIALDTRYEFETVRSINLDDYVTQLDMLVRDTRELLASC